MAPRGRAVVGFGVGRGYPVERFLDDDVPAADRHVDVALGTWDLRPRTPSSDFVVAVLSAA